MNIVLALSTVSLALQVAACLAALAIAQAPGWRRARIVAALAGTAGLYSLFDLLGNLFTRTEVALAWVTSANLSVAAAHVALWIWFSFSDGEGRWESVPQRLRWFATGHVVAAVAISLSRHAIDASRMDMVAVRWLRVEFVQPSLTPVATVSVLITLALLLVSFLEQRRQARRGVLGARANAIGFLFFFACAVEEVLVASGQLDFIYLAELGYMGLVAPLAAQFVRRFIADARRLETLTHALEREVQTVIGERDAARVEIAAQARFTALGRMAGGIGHEINNPLQVLTFALEELRDRCRSTADPALRADLAVAQEATGRIARIVDGLHAYTRGSDAALERLLPDALVRDAIRARDGALPVALDLRAAPEVLGDRVRLVQALQHAIGNAAQALGRAGARAPRITVAAHRAADGQAVLEVRDNGPGFPAALLPRVGEPFVTSDPALGNAGLGLFIIRGVAEAHGGRLEVENAPEGGAVVRLILPPAAVP